MKGSRGYNPGNDPTIKRGYNDKGYSEYKQKTHLVSEDNSKPAWNNNIGFATKQEKDINDDRKTALRDFYPHAVDNHHAKPKDYKIKEEVIVPEKLDDLDEVPFYLRETVQKMVDKRVKTRVDEEMAKFKEMLREEFAL